MRAASALDAGYDTTLGRWLEEGAELSGGYYAKMSQFQDDIENDR